MQLNYSLIGRYGAWIEAYGLKYGPYWKLWEEYPDINNVPTKTVRDVIPKSRLAKYGNFEYNEPREEKYKSLDWSQRARLDQRKLLKPRYNGAEKIIEPWQLEEVEECFLKLVSSNYRLSSSFINSGTINGS